MNQLSQTAHGDNEVGNLLSKAEKKKFKNYHLPLFACPSCAREGRNPYGQDSMINLMGSPCVSCGDSVSFGDFQSLSLKQFQKQDFAFHMNVNKRSHQEIIQKFQKNVLWECDQCGKHNLNLPKDSDGEPNIESETNCEGCAHPYEHGYDLLPFWALKQIGFDDGDDTSNVYELKKLGELQLLWLQALGKAKKIDAHAGSKSYEERTKLIDGISNVKSQSRWISGGKWREGTNTLGFLDSYLFGESQALSNTTQRKIQDYTRGILATNNPLQQTPYKTDTSLLQKYSYNLLHLDLITTAGTGLGATLFFILALAVLEKTTHIEIGETSHQAKIERQDKGTLELEYSISRNEPRYDSGVKYTSIDDETGIGTYQSYAQDKDFYRLQENIEPTTKNNGYITLDTGRTNTVWVSQSCPDTGSDSSWGGGGSGGTSGGSNGMGFGGSGDMFYKPENIHPFGENYRDITLLEPSLQERIGNISQGIFNVLIASPAYAQSCGYWDTEKITVSAERFITVREYQVWDWKNKTWFSSEITPGTDYTTTYQNLIGDNITDTAEQRVTNQELLMRVQIQQADGEIQTLPVYNESQWLQLHDNIGKNCEISKSYLTSWLYGIQSNDILEQCNIQ